MSNKCPNCGYNAGDNDAFCAMCGAKLINYDVEVNNKNSMNEATEAALDNINEFAQSDEVNNNETIDTAEMLNGNINQFSKSDDSQNSDIKINFQPVTFGNSMFAFVIIMILLSLAMAFSLYFVIKKQDIKKLEMRYKNMISNPAVIPELKEPKSLYELKNNLYNCEAFLSLYLKYSKDPQDKKEQVFISYLKEMEKLPHITSENIIIDDLDSCSSIHTPLKASKCAKKFSNDLKNVGISAYSDHNVVYLYPDYSFINKKYSKYLPDQMNKYLKLKAKYPIPARVGLELQVKPKVIADKINNFERLYTIVSDVYIRDEILRTIYNDFRTFIFTPSIYATTTQEMKPEFKNAYNYFINTKRKSQLRPVVISYMDKMRSYTETNFKNDYPYKIFEDSFDENVENSSLSDIFVQLRKSLFSANSLTHFTYVYSISASSWKKYEKGVSLGQGEYVFSEPDENNIISVYNNTFSLIQDLTLPKYCRLFLSGGSLYIYNSDRLNLSKVAFTGRNFTIQHLNTTDATSIFPGVRVINIDSYQNYNIYIDKENMQAAYIILSRYSQGFDGYKLSAVKGEFTQLALPDLFSLSTDQTVTLSFHHNSVAPNETSDKTPTYKITIRTNIQNNNDNGVTKYDEETAQQEDYETHNPVIMPKITNDEEEKDAINNLSAPPKRNIEPPRED